MDRMSPLDAAFFRLEDETSPMHVGSVSIMAGPAPTYGDVVRKVVSKLHLVPRYRQRARFVPGSLGRPVWVDDPHFQVLYHVRHSAVPSPGSPRELRNLAGRVLAQPLDRHKPLWELWVVEGLEGDRWAVISKVHHAMVDGVAGMELLSLVFDHQPDTEITPAPAWRPAPPPSRLRLLADAVTDTVRAPTQVLPAVPAVVEALRVPTASLGRVGKMIGRPQPSVPSLNGAISPHRRWRWTKQSFDDVRQIRQALGGSVNDVVLAATTRGFRQLLLERGEPVDGRVVRALVPVSVRAHDEHGANRVSGVIAELPVGLTDPVERLADIRQQMDRLKESRQATAGDVLMQLARGIPAPVFDVGLRSMLTVPQGMVQTVATNVPGPRSPLYLLGREMESCYPYVPLGWRVRVVVAIMSYAEHIGFGVTTDLDAFPDTDCLVTGIDLGFAELTEAARASANAVAGESGIRDATRKPRKPSGKGTARKAVKPAKAAAGTTNGRTAGKAPKKPADKPTKKPAQRPAQRRAESVTPKKAAAQQATAKQVAARRRSTKKAHEVPGTTVVS